MENSPNGKKERGPAECHFLLPRVDVICPAAVEIDAQVRQCHSYSDRREAAFPIDTSQRSSHLCISLLALLLGNSVFFKKEKPSIFSIVSRICGLRKIESLVYLTLVSRASQKANVPGGESSV